MRTEPYPKPETPVVDFESRRDASGDEPRTDVLDAVLERLTEIADSLQRLIDVQFERARAEMREKIFAVLGGILAGVLLVALTVTACIHLLRGLSGMVDAWLVGAPWAGDLVAGAAGLAIVLAAGLIFRAGARRSNLRRMRAKFPSEEGQ